MKILLCGDSHGQERTIKQYLKEAKMQDCDAIFVLGDFGYWEHMPEGIEFLNHVNSMAADNATIVYFLDGNHDKTSLLLQKYQAQDHEGFILVRDWVRYSPRGHWWTWEGVAFASLGGAYSVDKDWRLHKELKDRERYGFNTSGTLWFPEEEMSDEDLEIYLADMPKVDILLTHDKPRATNPPSIKVQIEECWPNQDRIQRALIRLKPATLFHGHLHELYSEYVRCGDDEQYTKVVGLAADGDPGSTWVIDLSDREVTNSED